MAERLALLRSFELYAHEAAELDQAKNFQRKVSSFTSESESDSTSGSETSTKSGSGGEEVAGKTHGDGEDSEIELKRKRQRVLENQRNRRRHAKLKAREQNARPPRPLAVVKALDWQTELAPGKEFDSKAELLLAAAEYSESVGACFKTSAKHPLAGGHGAQGCTTESKICLVCTSTKCMFCK